MTLADLLPLFDDRYEWISLQKVVRDEDRPVLDASAVRFVGDELADFADTAALTALMDGIVSVDTSVAHLAGALGRPLALMIPHTPDFRWLLERDDSPWYPSARFPPARGRAVGAVVERIAAGLPTLVGGGAR